MCERKKERERGHIFMLIFMSMTVLYIRMKRKERGQSKTHTPESLSVVVGP